MQADNRVDDWQKSGSQRSVCWSGTSYQKMALTILVVQKPVSRLLAGNFTAGMTMTVNNQ
nr:hypothetical protein [Cronobacter dublinensis]